MLLSRNYRCTLFHLKNEQSLISSARVAQGSDGPADAARYLKTRSVVSDRTMAEGTARGERGRGAH